PFIEILGLRLGPEQPDERIAAQSVEYAPPEKVISHSQPWIGFPVDGGLILPAGGIKTRPRQVAINQAGRRGDKEDRGGTTNSASGYHRLTLRCSVTPHQSAARARQRRIIGALAGCIGWSGGSRPWRNSCHRQYPAYDLEVGEVVGDDRCAEFP